jgi:hypothetical protein
VALVEAVRDPVSSPGSLRQRLWQGKGEALAGPDFSGCPSCTRLGGWDRVTC